MGIVTSRARLLTVASISVVAGYLLACVLAGLVAFFTEYSGSNGYWLPNGREVGGDFLALFTGGRLFLEDRAALYNYGEQLRFQQNLFYDGSGKLPSGALLFIYPPQMAAFFSLFSQMSLMEGYLLYLIFGALLVVSTVYLLARSFGLSLGQTMLLGLAFFGFMPLLLECLFAGQNAALGLFAVTLSFVTLRSNRPLLAGLCFSLCGYKPPLFILLTLFLLLVTTWSWRIGFLIGAFLQIAFSLALLGLSGFGLFLESSSKYRFGAELYPGLTLPVSKGMGLYAILTKSLGPSVGLMVLALIAGIALYFLVRAARGERNLSSDSFAKLFAGVLLASLFLSPQFQIYDFSIALLSVAIFAIIGLSPPVMVALVLLFTEWIFRGQDMSPIISVLAFSAFVITSLFEYARTTRGQTRNPSLR